MPPWPARPQPWPSTVDEALALPASWHVSERFLRSLGDDPDPEHRALMIRSYIAFLWNSFSAARWANTFLWKCIAFLVLFGLVTRLVTPANIRQLPRPLRRAHTSFVKHYSLAPLVGASALAARPVLSRSRWSAWTTVQVPLRPHALLVALYVVANLFVLFCGYDIPEPNGFYSQEDGPLAPYVRHLSDRAGVLALGSTPLVFLLAARNSPISWVAGVDFGTLQLYHRWVARVTFANATAHVLGYSYIHLEAHDWSFWSLIERAFLVVGWLAFFGGWVLCFGAWRRIRQHAYEIFLVVHIVAAVAWLVGAYFHVFLLGSRGASHLQPCYLTLALWGFDRGARRALVLWHNTSLGRVLRRGRPPTSSAGRQLGADGVLFGGSNDYVRLRIHPPSPWSFSRGGPGSFVYISCYSAGHRLWESHPFSISWPLHVPEHLDDDLDDDSAPSTPSSCASGSAQGKSTHLDTLSHAAGRAHVVAVEPPRTDPFDEEASPDGFELLVKRYSGFTQALVDSLAVPLSAVPSSAADRPLVLAERDDDEEGDRPGPARAPLRIIVEGPYGAARSSRPCAIARQALLVAGGSGIAMVTSQLADLGLKLLQQGGETMCERVAIVWSVREAETVALLVPYLHRLHRLFYASPSFRQRQLESTHSNHSSPAFLDFHLYVTTSSSSASPALASLDSLALPPSFLRIAVHSDGRRPDIGAHIDAQAPTAEHDPDELLVVTCGPAALCDAAREVVRSRLGRPGTGGAHRWEACNLMLSEEAVVW